jgi:hypothetical protein
MSELVQVQIECALPNLADLIDGLLQDEAGWVFSTQVARHYGLESAHFTRKQAVLGYEEKGLVLLNTQATQLDDLRSCIQQKVPEMYWSWVVISRQV